MSHDTDQPSSHAALWDSLVAAATLGSGRSGGRQRVGGALGALVDRLDGADPEGGLLGSAAAAALALRAGRLPAAADAEGAFGVAPEDALPVCSPAAATRLGAMLGGTYQSLLGEWLDALAARALLAPPEHLPELLDYGRRHADVRLRVVRALGARGRWLAAFNPEWAYAATGEVRADTLPDEAAIAERWETGGRAERLALLEALRAAAPPRARALVESTWREEKADERAAFVAALADRLSVEDEPFLEAALDDRSQAVRGRAAELLARLPESLLSRRMAERALALLRWSPARRGLMGVLGSPAKIGVTLPEACDTAMARDGIEPKPAGAGMGERAWWLLQIVRLTPPETWERAWGTTPDEIVQAEVAREWRGLLLKGWLAAATRHESAAWIEALLAYVGRLGEGERAALDGGGRSGEQAIGIEEIITLLPAARREAVILDILRRHTGPLGGTHPAMALLRRHAAPWGAELSRAVIAALGRRLADFDKDARSDYHLRASLSEFARAIVPELADEAAAAVPRELHETPYWGSTFEDFVSLLEFRRDMLRELDQHA